MVIFSFKQIELFLSLSLYLFFPSVSLPYPPPFPIPTSCLLNSPSFFRFLLPSAIPSSLPSIFLSPFLDPPALSPFSVSLHLPFPAVSLPYLLNSFFLLPLSYVIFFSSHSTYSFAHHCPSLIRPLCPCPSFSLLHSLSQMILVS